jgi:hypothetical protein
MKKKKDKIKYYYILKIDGVKYFYSSSFKLLHRLIMIIVMDMVYTELSIKKEIK